MIRSDVITAASLGHVNVQFGRWLCSHLPNDMITLNEITVRHK
jgi:hypothetical protein